MKKSVVPIIFLVAAVVIMSGCSTAHLKTTEIRRLPVSDLNDIISEEYVEFDSEISADGNGSIKVTCDEPIVVELYVLDDINIEDASLIYEAKMRSENLKGNAYLEMRCCFDSL
ncbi:MAG: hypothetical protein AB1746_03635, partial [Candidatus Zixiibacteriota bacterium]